MPSRNLNPGHILFDIELPNKQYIKPASSPLDIKINRGGYLQVYLGSECVMKKYWSSFIRLAAESNCPLEQLTDRFNNFMVYFFKGHEHYDRDVLTIRLLFKMFVGWVRSKTPLYYNYPKAFTEYARLGRMMVE